MTSDKPTYKATLILLSWTIIFGFISFSDGPSRLRFFFYISLIVTLVCLIVTFKLIKNAEINYREEQNEIERNRLIKEKKLIDSDVSSIDAMDPYEFEEYVKLLYNNLGYVSEKTKITGDFGADVIARNSNESLCIQVKLYTGNVSISAVQQVVAARNMYKCNKGVIVTNSYFTKSAISLARVNQVDLIDRDRLIELILSIKNADISNII